ncbi:MAG: bifunctional ornithine acetyltransferase/N-acetylglutamate synthase [Lachnospiraceae bacterium]|nr:bifunctional ornithine acetyltransferase/N-acetylglutamate synthase [Lachnospiraceae bacterium]
MNIITGGVTSPKGFKAASCHAGIKKNGTPDMAMIISDVPCETAGTFTQNIIKAAPVIWDRQVVYSGLKTKAVVINSGIANACTGKEGMEVCRLTSEAIAEAVADQPVDSVLIGSTGVIGPQIPMEPVRNGIRMMVPAAACGPEAGNAAARAIMTTDTHPKEVCVTFEIGGKTVTMGGMCKGAGMIHPNMCTMLCYITTDCDIKKELLQEALSDVVQDTFNMISVDGDTSTNDTVLVLANGMAGNTKVTEKGAEYNVFYDALFYVMRELCMMIAGDGEGATALFEVKVVNAETKQQAKVLAKAVITSNLTKAAIFGHDANWGRIVCAMGYSGAEFDPDKTDLDFVSEGGSLRIVTDGVATDYSEEEATKILSYPKVTALIDLKAGTAEATAWGCDLTYDYVKINADYRS